MKKEMEFEEINPSDIQQAAPQEVAQETPQQEVETEVPETIDQATEEPQEGIQFENEIDPVESTEEVKEETPEPLLRVLKEETKEEEKVKDTVETQYPEGIEKLVQFMNETGGSLDDYQRLNVDYSEMDDDSLLKEYYLQSKPHLDGDDVEILLEDLKVSEDDEDDDRLVRKKNIAKKEEIYKAKEFLKDRKDKYYSELKQKKAGASDGDQVLNKRLVEDFEAKTNAVFNDDFKGFDFDLGGDKGKLRYQVKNKESIKNDQSNLNNLLGRFLNEDGTVADAMGYHKAMFAATHTDQMASLFYDQGRADAIKEFEKDSKNLNMDPTQGQSSASKNRSTPGAYEEVDYKPSGRMKIKF